MKKKDNSSPEETQIEEVTVDDVLYGNQGAVLYKLIYRPENEYPVTEYLRDHFYRKQRITQFERWQSASNSKGKFAIRIFYKDRNGENYTTMYTFKTGRQAQKFIYWCKQVNIQSGID